MIYAIGDLHLSFDDNVEKPMDIYGGQWVNHTERLKQNWLDLVGPEDVVIIPGDISWALKLVETEADFEWIHNLPGQKVMIKGNHDLWWNSANKLNKLYEDIFFLHNTFFEYDKHTICGTRGWICPGDDDFGIADQKIYNRELIRLRYSLEAARQAGRENIIGALHYPPTNDKHQGSGFTELFTEYGVKQVVYGHLHGKEAYKNGISGILNGVEYKLVSLDYVECKPLALL